MNNGKFVTLLKTGLVLCMAAPLTGLQANDAHHPATGASAPAGGNGAPVAAAVNAGLAEGEIRKVDTEQGKLTIKHGPLVNLDMPPMTMVFRVKDPAFLAQLAAGDKVRFRAEKFEGQFVVTVIEKQSAQ